MKRSKKRKRKRRSEEKRKKRSELKLQIPTGFSHIHLLSNGSIFNEDDIHIHIDCAVRETPSESSNDTIKR